MFKWIDQSRFFIRLLQALSSFLAKRRGLPIVVGLLLIMIGFVLQLVNLSANSNIIELAHIILHNIGLIIALIGILLAEPLGQ